MLPFKVVSPAQRAKGWPWGGPMGPWARLTAYIVAFTTPFHGSHLMLLPMISGGRIQALAACIWAHNVRWTQLEQIRQHFLVLIPLGWITSSIFWIKMSWRIATSHDSISPHSRLSQDRLNLPRHCAHAAPGSGAQPRN